MTAQLSEDILVKVRKILAKAEDPAATPAEAEIYTAKASELIATYGIDSALLAERSPGSDPVTSRVVVLEAPYALDKSALLSGVALALRCQAVQRTRYDDGAKVISMHLFGFASDLLRAEVLYTSLLLQATTALQRVRAPAGESVAAFRRSWIAGFASAVVHRLDEAEDRARHCAEDRPATGRSVALVLADRSVAVRNVMEAEYPYLRKAAARQLSGSGRRSGFLAGQRADLGRSSVGQSFRGRLS